MGEQNSTTETVETVNRSEKYELTREQEVFLDGYVSGFSTALINMLGLPEVLASQLAQTGANIMLDDPATLANVREAVRRRMSGDPLEYGEQLMSSIDLAAMLDDDEVDDTHTDVVPPRD